MKKLLNKFINKNVKKSQAEIKQFIELQVEQKNKCFNIMPIYHDNFIYYLKDPKIFDNLVYDLFRIKNNFQDNDSFLKVNDFNQNDHLALGIQEISQIILQKLNNQNWYDDLINQRILNVYDEIQFDLLHKNMAVQLNYEENNIILVKNLENNQYYDFIVKDGKSFIIQNNKLIYSKLNQINSIDLETLQTDLIYQDDINLDILKSQNEDFLFIKSDLEIIIIFDNKIYKQQIDFIQSNDDYLYFYQKNQDIKRLQLKNNNKLQTGNELQDFRDITETNILKDFVKNQQIFYKIENEQVKFMEVFKYNVIICLIKDGKQYFQIYNQKKNQFHQVQFDYFKFQIINESQSYNSQYLHFSIEQPHLPLKTYSYNMGIRKLNILYAQSYENSNLDNYKIEKIQYKPNSFCIFYYNIQKMNQNIIIQLNNINESKFLNQKTMIFKKWLLWIWVQQFVIFKYVQMNSIKILSIQLSLQMKKNQAKMQESFVKDKKFLKSYIIFLNKMIIQYQKELSQINLKLKMIIKKSWQQNFKKISNQEIQQIEQYSFLIETFN